MNSRIENRKNPGIRRSRVGAVAGGLVRGLFLLLVLSLVVFFLARACPGDPLRSWYGDGVDRLSAAQKEAMRRNLGLDRSLWVQYGLWLRNLFQGSLGISLKYKRPVTAVLGSVAGNTAILGLLAYVMTFLPAFRIGSSCALKEGSRKDRRLSRTAVVTGNIPSFFLGLLLILFFAVKIRLFPTGGAYSYGMAHSLPDRIWHLVLPCAVLVLEHVGYYGLMVRNLLVEETRKDYVLLHKSQGIPREKILRKYCMKNILPGMIPAMTMAVPHILGGTYVVEMVFGYPGLGTLAFESALYKDFNVLMAVTLLTGALVIFCNMLGEVLSAAIDPRMRDDAADFREVDYE